VAQTRFYSSTAQPTILSSSISNTTTSIPVVATTGFPVLFPYTIAVDYGSSLEELCDVTNASGLNLTVTRAVDGTSAANHSVGAVVRHVSSARDFTNANVHIGSSSGVHGITGNVVGDTDTQTLSNKTLNAPALSGTITGAPTFSGNVVFSGNPSFTGSPTFSNPVTLTNATLAGGTINGNWTANATFQSGATGNVPLIVKGFAGQTADLFDVQTSGAANVLRVLPTGVVISNQATGTQSLVVNAITGTTVDMVDFQSNGSTVLAIQSGGIIQATSAALSSEIVGSVVPSVGSFDAFRIYAGGELEWGPGTGARDTNIQRTGAAALTLTGSLTATGTLAGTNLLAAAATYTPTIGGGALTLGNGTMTARYTQAAGSYHIQIQIVAGTTTTLASTGNLTFSLPNGITQNSNVAAVGNSYFTKTSGGSFNQGAAVATGGGGVITVFIVAQSNLTWGSFNTTNGGAVASGSVIAVDITLIP
jgi:hypothetical protein